MFIKEVRLLPNSERSHQLALPGTPNEHNEPLHSTSLTRDRVMSPAGSHKTEQLSFPRSGKQDGLPQIMRASNLEALNILSKHKLRYRKQRTSRSPEPLQHTHMCSECQVPSQGQCRWRTGRLSASSCCDAKKKLSTSYGPALDTPATCHALVGTTAEGGKLCDNSTSQDPGQRIPEGTWALKPRAPKQHQLPGDVYHLHAQHILLPCHLLNKD